MGIEKLKLLACECVYWHSINADIEKYIKQCATCLEFQQTLPKEKKSFIMRYHSGPGKQLEQTYFILII